MRNPTPGKRSLESLVSRHPRVYGGSPFIAGTRIRVADVVGSIRSVVADPARTMDVLTSITTRQFEAAMTYYRSHRFEIEAEIKQDEAAAPS